jgi:hypothetical protein
MFGTRSGTPVAALAIIAMSGCFANLADGIEDAFEELELDEPFAADVQVEGVERGSVRAGLFTTTAAAELMDAEGMSSTGDVELSVAWSDGGRIDAYLPSDASSASVQPLEPASLDDDGVVFTLPELSADTQLVAVVWYDDDGDGALDVSAESGSEAARTIMREHEGAPHYLTSYSYDAAEDTYSATAVGDLNGTTNNLILSRDQLSGWSVTLDRATDDPG